MEPISTLNTNDINLLARLIYAEARGEPYTGQVAVGAVVLNRVKSSNFPNTLRCQYSPYALEFLVYNLDVWVFF